MKSDYSIWEVEAYHSDWDIIILGAGLMGINTGISLLEKNPDQRIAVIDRWFIPLGASTRNAGFATFGSPTEILYDLKTIGEAACVALIKNRWSGLQKLLSRLDLSYVQYENNGGYEMYRADEYAMVHDELQYLNQLLESATGHRNVFQPVTVPEGLRGFSHAVYNSLEGQLHPGFMMQHLTSRFQQLGGKVITGCHVERIEESETGVSLHHATSIPITGHQLIVTTNSFALDLLPTLDLRPARNIVLTTSPVRGLTWKGTFHYDQGYVYFRNIRDRILIGGARNKDMETEMTSSFGDNPKITEILEQFLWDHLAEKGSCAIEYRWSGIIGVGSLKRPIVERVSPRILVGVRFFGMGVALSAMIGDQLSELAWQQS